MNMYVSTVARRAMLAASVVCVFGTAAGAQTLPSPWQSADVGSPTLAGTATHASGVFTIEGAGTDIWNGSDQFRFVYQQISGDVELIARVDSLDAPSVYAKAGLMIRASLAANAVQASALVTAERGSQFQYRASAGASSVMPTGRQDGQSPVWLRLVRAGSTITGYSSTDGTSWTSLGSGSVPAGTNPYVGLVVSSNYPSARATAVVSNVRTGKQGLPSGQRNQDIGGPAIAGSAAYDSGRYTLRGGGWDIWDTSDQFHFVHQPLTGNGEVVARVASLTQQHEWSKAGVMIRESLTAQSRHAMVVTSVSKGYAFQRRPETGGYSEHTSGGSGTAPGWVRLVRTGDLFEAYRSSNGTSWTRIGSDTIPMTDTVYVGLAVTSHDTSAATTAVIDSFRVTGGAAGNRPPAVSITAPGNGAQYTAPTTVSISATASDPEARMASVDFYAGSTLIVRDSTAPYSASWSASTAGTYSLTAVAHDADGGTTTSGAVSVSVSTATNRPPTVSLATNGTTFVAPASITLTATAADPEGQLARVEFFNGSTRLGTDSTAPYSFSWPSVAAGSYSLRAVAYDQAGASATSSTVSVTVTTSSSTAPRLVTFTASTNHATAVTYYVLKIFAAGANPSTATPVSTSDLGKPTPASNGDITVDRATLFNALAAGNYLATVTAVGSGGQAQSASVTFTR